MSTSGHATGAFEVKVTPLPGVAQESVASGRLTIEKTFQGDLVGSSAGVMWTVDTAVKGSAGYVAIERFSGTLSGRRGSFTLLHQGTMQRGGEFQMRLVVVPDSGTEELEGLGGTMAIILEGGKHHYRLDYALPDRAPVR